MATIEGGLREGWFGDLVDDFCKALAVSSTVWGVGLALNWWNPVGWADAAALIAGGACAIYGIF